MFRHFLASACMACASLFFVGPVSGADDLKFSQLHHKAWGADDGAPSGIGAVVQTTDGFLWAGSSQGVFRFDGVRFESIEAAYHVGLLSGGVSALLASSDGGLWIGYRFGGASYFRDGKITHYRPDTNGPHSLAGGSIGAFAEGKDGLVWASSSSLNVFKNNAWQLADPALPMAGDAGVLVDRRGGVWAGLNDGLYWRANTATAFHKVSGRAGKTYLAEAPDGTVWALTNRLGLSRFDSRTGQPLSLAKSVAQAIPSGRPMFDRQGNLWSATNDYALLLLPRSALQRNAADDDMVDVLTEKGGLGGGIVTSAFQDREGNVWVSTDSGLHRFREGKVSPVAIPAPDGAVMLTMAAAEDGKIWVSDWRSGLYLVGSAAEPVDEKLHRMTFMYRAPSGRVWMGNPFELWVREKNRLKSFRWPYESSRIIPQAAIEDSAGGLWVSLAGRGLFRLFDGTWEEKTALLKPGSTTVNAMAHDAAGGFWASHGENRVLHVSGKAIRKWSAADGLDVGPVIAISADQNRVWLGGVDGVMGHDGQRFHHLEGRDAHRFKGVSGIVATGNGDVWMNGDDGIIHITSAELARWGADKRYRVAYEKLDYLDGVVGKPQHTRPLPTALQASDGRLWFTTGRNLTVVDPARVLRNGLPPPVAITRIDIDGVESRPGAAVVLAADARRIEIGFAGLSLSIPERNRYRYRLTSVDRDWIPANRNRSASYTNLAPGRYRFEVSASNNDGVWSTRPAQLSVEVLPMFYQTWWFRCAMALLFVMSLWLAHRLRLKVLTRRISDRLQSEQTERMRIARELHDTLLQGVGSLSLVMHRAIRRVEPEHPVLPFLSDGLKQAESVIEEGRMRVARLRVNVAAGDAMVDELGSLGLELTADSTTRFVLTVQGNIRPLEAQVAEESKIIAREAIWNAVQHAHADTISLTVEFGRRRFVLRVHDDGPGLPPEVLATGAREGHWGMPGMRERACRIGGRLEIVAVKGTTVELTVPAALAYKQAKRVEQAAV